MSIVIVSSKNKGHYESYSKLVELILDRECKVVYKINIKEFLFAEKYIVIDGDGVRLLLILITFLRSIRKCRTYFMSVRTESFVSKGLYARVKRFLLIVAKVQGYTRLISIHKGNSFVMDKLNSLDAVDYIYDPQLWDLGVFGKCEEKPSELDIEGRKFLDGGKKVLLVLGALNNKRSVDELIAGLTELSKMYQFVFAGVIREEYLNKLYGHDIILINRYVTDEEIMYLYNMADIVYAYYAQDVNRPSGIFGRAVQLDKFVLIRKDGFLDQQYGAYKYAIKVDSLSAIKIDEQLIAKGESSEGVNASSFDDSVLLRRFLS